MKLVLPSGNTHLTKAEFEHCCSLIDYYTEEATQIIHYCKARGLDPELYDRANVWKEGFVADIIGMVLSKKYNNIDRLRLIAFHFSGYRVMDLSWCNEPHENKFFDDFFNRRIKELPEDIDSLITAALDPIERLSLLIPRLNSYIDIIDNKYLHGQPLRFGEIAVEHRGFMINGDSQRYWGTMAVLYKSRIVEHLEHKIAEKGFCRVMEIGAGYGGLAYQLKKTYGEKLQFIAVDLVESLIFSSCYLTTLLTDKPLYYKDEKTIKPENGLVFVPSFRSPEFFKAISNIDLCINTISMNEMSSAQVGYYGKKISKSLSRDGLFFECNWAPSAAANANRVDVKSSLEPHFKYHLSVGNTEVASDGDLDLWSNRLHPDVEIACKEAYSYNAVVQKRRYTKIHRLLIRILRKLLRMLE